MPPPHSSDHPQPPPHVLRPSLALRGVLAKLPLDIRWARGMGPSGAPQSQTHGARGRIQRALCPAAVAGGALRCAAAGAVPPVVCKRPHTHMRRRRAVPLPRCALKGEGVGGFACPFAPPPPAPERAGSLGEGLNGRF